MSFTQAIPVVLGNVEVHTTSGRGFTPEELTEMALKKIISIGNNSHPAIRAQAEVYRDHIRTVITQHMYKAIESHNTTIANRLIESGHPELVALLK